MPGLIQKSGFIKSGAGGGHYAEYIATREGVELIEAPHPTHDGGGYLEYMAERPRSHGLFSADSPADLEKTMEEINGHTGLVWTFVYSLKREDAHRLGYENSESWRKLLLAHQIELAQAMKISPKNFRWCAAFHDEKHHPHIHMMVWSANPKQGFLTEKGIEKMRSQLSNEIFRDELLSLYQQKDLSYSQVRDAAVETMGRLIREMETGLCHSPVIAEQMETLSKMLEDHKGKKVYGYLKKPVKTQVDAIVDELSKIPEVAECYEQWNQLRDELERYLTFSAEQGNQYAQYTLGKLYLPGQDVKPDREQAWEYFCQSAEQGNEYAAFFLKHFDQVGRPNVFLSATRLLHHLGQIFWDNSVPPAAPVGQHIDRKLRRKIQEKKIAMGHKPDDHEEEQNQGGMVMGGM